MTNPATVTQYMSAYQLPIIENIKAFDQSKNSYREYFKSIQNNPFCIEIQEFLQTLRLKLERNKDAQQKVAIMCRGQSVYDIYSSDFLHYLKQSALKEQREFFWLDSNSDEREFFYAITYIPYMESLETLHLNFICIGSKLYLSLFCKALKFLRNLNHLSLPGCGIGNGLEFSSKAEESEALKGFSEALCYLPNLLTLDLSYNGLTLEELANITNVNYGSESLSCFQCMSNLSKLNFSYGKIDRVAFTIDREKKTFMLCQFDFLRRLQELYLCNQDLYGFMDTLAESVLKLRLIILDLSGNGLRVADIEKLFERLRNYYSLQELHLCDNEIGDGGVQLILSTLNSKLPRLRVLDVEKNKISMLGHEKGSTEILPALKIFNISKNSLSENFERTLSVILSCFTRVDHLYLSDCDLSDENFKYFIQTIDIGRCCNLYCDLEANYFTGGLIPIIESAIQKIEKFTKLLLKPKIKNTLLSHLKQTDIFSIFPT